MRVDGGVLMRRFGTGLERVPWLGGREILWQGQQEGFGGGMGALGLIEGQVSEGWE